MTSAAARGSAPGSWSVPPTAPTLEPARCGLPCVVACFFARLLPTIRSDMIYEREAIRDAAFSNMSRLRETASVDENAAAIAAFLDASPEVARKLAETPYLFVD